LPPLFSCSACDAWRERIHNKGSRSIQRRDFLNDRYQCSRAKKGKPIKVRVVCKAAAVANPRITSATTLLQVDKKIEHMRHLVTPNFRSCRIRASVGRNQLASGASKVLPSPSEMKQVSKRVTQHSAASCKSKRTAEVIERLEGLKKRICKR
jgi:hypothetical protein